MVKIIFVWIIGSFFVLSGANHFINPTFYLEIMPDYLPWHHFLLYASGVAEIAGGIGVLPKVTRKLAGWALIVLLVAVFSANIQAALQRMDRGGIEMWILFARLPLQFVHISWVYYTCIKTPRTDA